MAESVGSIVYTVAADTSDMIKAEAEVNKSIGKITKEFAKADQAVRGFSKSQYDLGRSINSMGQVIDKNGKIVAGATLEYRKLATTANAAFSQVDAQINGVASAVNRNFTHNIQNASFQIQDFAVQIASGQSGMVAFVQQLPQLIGGFGLLGAGIATAVAVFGGLYLAFGDAQTNAEKLEKAIEGVQAVITLGVDGVTNYTEEMQKLANLSETLAQLRLSLAIADQNKAIELGLQGIREALDDTRGSFTTYTGQVEKLLKVSRGTDGFAAAERAFRDYSSAVSTFSKSGDVENLEQSLLALSEAGASNTEVGQNLIRTTVDLIAKFRQGQITIEALKSGLEDTGSVTTETTDSFDRLNTSLNAQLIELQQGARAAFQYKLANSDLTPEQQAAALATYDRVEAQKQLNKETQDFLMANERALEQEKRRQQQERNKAQTFVSGAIRKGLSQSELFAQDLERLTLLRQQNLIEEEQYNQAVVSLTKRRNDEIQRLNQANYQANKIFGQATQDTLGALGNAFGNFAQIAQQGGKESFESYKKLATAQALISTFLAANNALATPAPFPIPQILAGSIAALGLANVANIRNQQYSGARQFGGPVTSGKSYLVGERGPEIFTPNGSGSITSNKDSFGSGGVTVNVNNYASNDLNFDVSKQGEIIEIAVRRSVDAVAGQINSGQGKVPNAMRQSGTFRTDARRGR